MKPILADGGYGFLIFVIIMIISGISKLVRKAKEDAERMAPRPPVRGPGPSTSGKAISLRDFLEDLEGESKPPPPPRPTVQQRPVPPPPPRPGVPPRPMAPPRPVMTQRPPAPPRPSVPSRPRPVPRPVMPQAQAPRPRPVPFEPGHVVRDVPDVDKEIDLTKLDDEKFEKKFEFLSSFEKKQLKQALSSKPKKRARKKEVYAGAYKIREHPHGFEVGLTSKSARQAIVLSEILRPPLALRQSRRG